MDNFYVYAFLRDDRYTPYYIGKGKGNRCYSNSRIIPRPQDESRIVKVKENLTEEESFALEETLILFWGRKDLGTGVLNNLTDGGDGNSGWCPPLQWKEKRRKYMLENNPFRGQTHTQETRQRLSKKKRGRVWVTNGTDDKMVFLDDIPDGYKRGRTKQNKLDSSNTKGMFWVTNGKENRVVREVPEGFVRGRKV